jgi:hypothetical protein
MESFKRFLEETESEEEKNVKVLIVQLPKNHKRMLHKYKFTYTPNNTLKGDKKHIGYIHKDKIVVAAPWNYSRKFTTLHEIAHLVWEHLVDKNMRKEWKKVLDSTKEKKQDQSPEELFCMAYACYYSGDHCPKIHDHESWMDFIKKLK